MYDKIYLKLCIKLSGAVKGCATTTTRVSALMRFALASRSYLTPNHHKSFSLESINVFVSEFSTISIRNLPMHGHVIGLPAYAQRQPLFSVGERPLILIYIYTGTYLDMYMNLAV